MKKAETAIVPIIPIVPKEVWHSEKELKKGLAYLKRLAEQGVNLDEELQRRGIELYQLPGPFHDLIYENREERAKAKLEIEVSAEVYGFLCAGALVNGLTWQEMAGRLIASHICDWSNDNYRLEEV